VAEEDRGEVEMNEEEEGLFIGTGVQQNGQGIGGLKEGAGLLRAVNSRGFFVRRRKKASVLTSWARTSA
jgi:hypothetical protein